MDLELRGRTAVVTGCSMGIGREIARVLAAEGVPAVVARRGELLKTLQDEIEAAGWTRPHALAIDLADRASAARVRDEALARLGHVDILVNNTGGSWPTAVDAPDSVWDDRLRSTSSRSAGSPRRSWTIVFFIVFFNTFRGARSVDADLIHSARFLGASERQVMRTVIVPSALAWTLASLTPSISFALIGVVVGEFLGSESGGGLGYLIIQSLGTLNAADMMVALLTLGVIGIVMALGIKQVEMRLLRWRPEYRKR